MVKRGKWCHGKNRLCSFVKSLKAMIYKVFHLIFFMSDVSINLNMGNTFNLEKFKQVLHYIISQAGNLDNVGKTLLFKMLYFLDFDSYEINESSITGETYFKLPMGPAPKHFDNAINQLEKEKKVKTTDCKFFGRKKFKFISIKEPELNLLNGEELKIIDKTIKKLSGMNAAQVSHYSHLDMPWKATKDNAIINYELVFYRCPVFSVREENVAC